MNIRVLEKSDLCVLSEIAQRSDKYPWSKHTFLDCAKTNYFIWGAESSDKIIQGFAIILYQLDVFELLNICVDHKFQRQGVGQCLLQYVIAQAKRLGVKSIRLEVRASNLSAISLYRSLDFIEVGIRKNYYATTAAREDALLFVLQL
jgi:[ribosomal protein S18]-alanine N-acetyltransferase